MQGQVRRGGLHGPPQERPDRRRSIFLAGGRALQLGSTALKLIYGIIGAALIVTLSYLFGHTLLEGHLFGNDTPWALSMVQWYDRWFPGLPVWFPLEGAGTPLLFLYQPGTSLILVILHRLSGLTLVQTFRLVEFLSVPVCALGIYLLVWRKTSSQTAALIAGLLYPVSSATWYWSATIGLYAQSVTIMFVPWALLLFDAYLSGVIRDAPTKPTLWHRMTFPAAASLFGIMFICHIPTALSFVMAITAYAVAMPVIRARERVRWRLVALSVLRAWAGILAGLLVVAVWMLPFIHNNLLANREGLSYTPADMVSSYDFSATLALAAPEGTNKMTFATPVVALAAIGIAAGLIRREVPLAWGILAVGSVLFVAMPRLSPAVVLAFAKLWETTNDRAVLIAIVLMPATAGYGAAALGRFVTYLPTRLLSLVTQGQASTSTPSLVFRMLRPGFIAAIAIAASGLAVTYGPTLVPGRNGYGVPGWNGPLPIAILGGEISLLDPPAVELSDEGDLTNRADILEFSRSLAFSQETRVDVSPYLGGITEALSLYTDASIVNIYGYNASLIHAMWAYQIGVCFMHDYGTPEELEEVARWFGLQYVILNRDTDPLDRYESLGWPVVYPQSDDTGSIVQVRRFPEAPGMASLLSRPVVLVIGGYESSIYEQAFKTFVRGALTYDRGLVVEGTHNIDDYSLEELRRFDAVLLHGYGYKSHERAWRLLEQYVAEGGALYIDTGWQYFTPDWQMERAPEVLPVASLTWTHFGAGDMPQVEDLSIAGGISAESFSPLIWDGQPWGISASPTGLRDWAHPVLSVLGIPVVAAGEYGEGRVVWSGMNLIGHATTYDNAAERRLLGQLLAWLVPSRGADEIPAPEVTRENPDHLRFALSAPVAERTYLLWREAYSPDWHANVVVDGRRVDIPIYRAGPGMMLLMLPAIDTPGAVIEMGYSLGWLGVAGKLVSFATLAVLATWTLFPRPWEKLALRLRRRRTKIRAKGNVPWMSKPSTGRDVQTGVSSGSWSEETPYDRMADQPDEKGLGSLEGGIDDDEQVRALWESFQASAATTGQGLEGADQMIQWWRKARAPRTGESADEDSASDGKL